MYDYNRYCCDCEEVFMAYIAWRKIKRRSWKIPINSHKHIVHNLSSDCKYLIEKRILKFIHNGLNSNSVCENLLQVKLTCRNSCFADNYRFLSHKYNISSSDWTNNIAILLKKLEIKFHSKQNISDAATVKELCNMRDNADFNLLSFSEITKLIADICIN